ncbi:MAG: hypothetical protein ACYDER_18355 [Ktedonobacteraceae bacterium]
MLALTSLSEATAITLHRSRDSQGFPDLKRDATDAGETAGEARQIVERRIGKPVVSSENYLHLKKVKKQGKENLSRKLSDNTSIEQVQQLLDSKQEQREQGQQLSLFNETNDK